VVWRSWDGHDYEIDMYDPVTGLKTLTNNDYKDDYAPQINDAGQVVWCGKDPSGTDDEIFRYELDGSTTRITTNNYYDWDPQINERGEVTWWGGSNWDACEIYLYDTEGHTEPITSNDHRDDSPQINDRGQVAWVGGEIFGEYEVYIWDPQEGTTQITSGADEAQNERINKLGQVVWIAYDGDFEIFLYDTDGSTRQITDNDYDDYWPRLNDMGWVVWYGTPTGTYDSEIFMWRPEDGITQLTDNFRQDRHPEMSGRWITWERDETGVGTEIYETHIPEPGTLALMALGLPAVALRRRRRCGTPLARREGTRRGRGLRLQRAAGCARRTRWCSGAWG